MKNPRLIQSKQGAISTDGDRVDLVTLLFDGYLLVVLSFGLLSSCEVFKSFDMVKHVSIVPFLLPQQTITDLKIVEEMFFILFECGVVSIYDLFYLKLVVL